MLQSILHQQRSSCDIWYFIEIVEGMGGPPRCIRTDKGTENVAMQNLQCLLCINGTELLIVVSSSYTGHDYTAYMNCMHLAVRERPSNLITHELTHLNLGTAPHQLCTPLQWRHSEHHGVAHHRRLDCLLNRLFRRRSKKTSTLRVTDLGEGIHRWPLDSAHKGTLT